MKFFFALGLLALLIPGGYSACKSLEEIDECAYQVSFLENRDLKVPTSDGEVIELCGKAKGGLTCIKDQATECMKGPLKAITLKVLNDLDKHLNTHCDSQPHRAEFLSHISCFTDANKAEAVRLCSDKHMVMMEKVYGFAPADRVGGGCCTAHGFKECIIGKVTELCSGETGDYFNDMIAEVAEESVNMICADYINLDQCKSKYGKWGELESVLNSNDVKSLRQHHFKTVIPLIIKMMRQARK